MGPTDGKSAAAQLSRQMYMWEALLSCWWRKYALSKNVLISHQELFPITTRDRDRDRETWDREKDSFCQQCSHTGAFSYACINVNYKDKFSKSWVKGNEICRIPAVAAAAVAVVSVVVNNPCAGHIEALEVQLHSFLTSPLDRDEWIPSRRCRFTARKGPPVPIECETGLAPQPIGTFWGKKNILSLPGIKRRLLIRPVHKLVTTSTEVSCIGKPKVIRSGLASR